MARHDGTANLQPVTTKEEARERGRKGGQTRARRAKERKAAAEVLDEIMRMPLRDEDIVELAKVRSMKDVKDLNLTVWDVIMLQQARKAMKGDTKAVELLMGLLGDGGSASVAPLDRLAKAIERATEASEDDRDSTP